MVEMFDPRSDLLEKMLPDYFDSVTRIMKPLNASQRKQLVGLLQQIQQGLAADPLEEPAAV